VYCVVCVELLAELVGELVVWCVRCVVCSVSVVCSVLGSVLVRCVMNVKCISRCVD
jgi:hypothetical protein